jgi:hypothetical protein
MNGVLQAAPDGRMHTAGVEALRKQVAVNAPGHGRFVKGGSVPQFAIKRLRDQGVLVEVAEDLGNDRPREVALDTEGFDAAQCPQAPVPFHMSFSPGAREGGTPVVERAFLEQAQDGRVNVVGPEFEAREPRSHLCFRQLAACEQLQAGDVRIRHRSSLPAFAPAALRRGRFGCADLYRVIRVIVVWTARAISSRAVSPVVVMPAILSFISSTLLAQRSVSSAEMISFSYSL